MKNKKPLKDREMLKETFSEAVDLLFRDIKNKTEIMAAVKGMQLSRNTVTGNLEDQLKNDTDCCECFSLQVEESTDITDVEQCISIRMTLNNMSAKEEILTVLPLKGHRERIFHKLPWS